VRRLDWRRLVQALFDPGANSSMKLADIDGGRLMNWLLGVQRERQGTCVIELHVVGQGYVLRAEGDDDVDELFIEPRRLEDEATPAA
jgi:hypothetical protein